MTQFINPLFNPEHGGGERAPRSFDSSPAENPGVFQPFEVVPQSRSNVGTHFADNEPSDQEVAHNNMEHQIGAAIHTMGQNIEDLRGATQRNQGVDYEVAA